VCSSDLLEDVKMIGQWAQWNLGVLAVVVAALASPLALADDGEALLFR